MSSFTPPSFGKPAGFGQRHAPQPAAPSPSSTPPAGAQPHAPSSPSEGRRRAVVTDQSTVDYSRSGARGVDPKAADPIVEGEFPCYVSKVSQGKDYTFLTIRIHAPGSPFHGVEKKVYATPSANHKSATAAKFERQRIVGFFQNSSGKRESEWESDPAKPDARIPPFADFWTRAIDVDGGLLVVPVMLWGVFKVDANENNPSAVYQRFDSAAPMQPLLVAPLPTYVPVWLAQMNGWPGEIKRSEYGDSFQVSRDQAAAIDQVYLRDEWGRSLSGEPQDNEVAFP